MSQIVEGIDAAGGAIPQGSRDSLAVSLLRQILHTMQKVNTRYGVYTQPGPVDNTTHTEEQQALITNPYRSTLQLQVSPTNDVSSYRALIDGGPLVREVIDSTTADPLFVRGIVIFEFTEEFGARGQGFIDLNTPPTGPITMLTHIVGF